MTLFIYEGEGVSRFSLQETLATFQSLLPKTEVKTITSQDVRNGDWQQEASLFILPGGRDIPYDRDLSGAGTDSIRSFVEKGGSFIGICAGAYFASKEVIFEKGTPLEVHEERSLQFYPGSAVGTLFRFRPFQYRSENGAHAPLIKLKNQSLPLYYNGGCYFSKANTHCVKVIGTYEAYQDRAAIISCHVGKGKAYLSGVHFEVRPETLLKEHSPEEVYHTLKKFDEERQIFLQSLLEELSLS